METCNLPFLIVSSTSFVVQQVLVELRARAMVISFSGCLPSGKHEDEVIATTTAREGKGWYVAWCLAERICQQQTNHIEVGVCSISLLPLWNVSIFYRMAVWECIKKRCSPLGHTSHSALRSCPPPTHVAKSNYSYKGLKRSHVVLVSNHLRTFLWSMNYQQPKWNGTATHHRTTPFKLTVKTQQLFIPQGHLTRRCKQTYVPPSFLIPPLFF